MLFFVEEINLRDFFEYFQKKFLVILLITLVIIAGGLIYSLYFKVPQYKATATIVLASDNTSSSTITQSDITINKNLVSTYAEIVKSKSVLNQVISDLHLGYEYSDLAKKISVSAVSDTQIISITMTDTNANNSYIIANDVAKVFKTKVEEIYNIENVSILDYAEEPSQPANINIIKDTVIYVCAGVLVSLIYLFISIYFDRNVKSVSDVEKSTELPIMGSIRDGSEEIKSKKIKSELIVSEVPKSNFAEDLRTVRTNLEFTSIDKKVKTVLVTSSIPGEGKSFITSNLAVAFAQNNKKVIIVDCDLRKGRIHKIFGNKAANGLSNLISKLDIDHIDDYVTESPIKNLSYLNRGILPPNPSELLNSKVFSVFLKLLSEKYDYVILDGTPITNLPDSLILSKMVDTTLLVTTVGYTPMDALLESKKSLENVNAKIGGVIVNKVPIKKSKYYYSNYKYE